MEQEVIILAPDDLEKAVYDALMANNEELLNYLYEDMMASDYMKNRIYKKRCKTKKSLIVNKV